MSHVPQSARVQLQPNQEQHHYHAEFGHVLKVAGFGAHQMQDRTNHNPGGEVAQYRPKAQPRGKWHRDHCSAEVNGALIQKYVHGASLCWQGCVALELIHDDLALHAGHRRVR